MTSSNLLAGPADPTPSVMPAYNARVLGYLTTSITYIIGIVENHFDESLIWFVPAAMLWPHLLYFVIRHLKLNNSRSEEHTSELQSRFGISYAVFCLKKKKTQKANTSP